MASSKSHIPAMQDRPPKRVLLVCGTRPEIIKLAPVYRALKAPVEDNLPPIDCAFLATGQHTDMADHTFAAFGITPEHDYGGCESPSSLTQLQSVLLANLDRAYRDLRPDLVMVQGDTATSFIGALSAFSARIPVAHLEAGLRSFDLDNPYPEEGFRSMIAQIAALHFAPTPRAATNLTSTGVAKDRVLVTGNTVTDAAFDLAARYTGWPDGLPAPDPRRRLVLITAHRRESWGHDLKEMCRAIATLHDMFEDLFLLFPVHLNPRVRGPVADMLGGLKRLHLTDPLPYERFIPVLKRAHLILTDSGGIQEEAPTFGKPCLVMRRVTERPEAIEAGTAKLVGTGHDSIVAAVKTVLTDKAHYDRMSRHANPFGDGRASARIAVAVSRWFHGIGPILAPAEEFDPKAQDMAAMVGSEKNVR